MGSIARGGNPIKLLLLVPRCYTHAGFGLTATPQYQPPQPIHTHLCEDYSRAGFIWLSLSSKSGVGAIQG